MLGTNRVHWAFALAAALVAGCDGDGKETTTGGGGQGGGTTTSSTTETETESESTTTTSESTGGSGGGLTCENGEGPVLAVSQLDFGEGTSGEWKKVGFNLDGKESTAISQDLCKPYEGTMAVIPYPDGDNGIDNSFGKNLLPLILLLYPTWAEDINNGIDNGYFTSLVKMECLPPTGDVPKFTTKLFGATSLPSTPIWDGTDKWPVAPELLSDPMDPLSSTVSFGESSVTGELFDTGQGGVFILTVPLKSQGESTSIKLTLYNARVTMNLKDGRTTATGGIIGGVLNTEELVAEIQKVGYLLQMCGTQPFQNIIDEVRRASDILSDGTQDPEKTCDGITIGLSFEMAAAQLGDVGPGTPVGESCK